MERLTIESADIRVSNSNEEGRDLDISATAHVENGNVTRVENGNAYRSTDRSHIAYFDSSNPNHLRVDFHTDENRPEILAAVEDFIAKARENNALATTTINN